MLTEERESKKFINLGVIFNDKRKVLMIRRVKLETGSDSSVLKWAFPGGKQRYNESREECVRREVLDETGYDIKPIKQISMRIHPQFLIMIVYHLCYLNSQKPIAEPKEPHEIAEIKRVKAEKIPNLITTNLDPLVKKELRIK